VLLSKLGKGGTYTGFDVEEWWVERGRKNLRRFPNATVLQGDVRSLPLEDGGFDLAVVHITLHDIPEGDRGPIIVGLAGKIRPGGRLFIKEPTKDGHGIPEAEVWSLVEAAGLHATKRYEGRGFFMGPMVEGHFTK